MVPEQGSSPTRVTPLETPELSNLRWLLRLRWGAVGVQLLLIGAIAVVLKVDVPWGPVGALWAVQLASNAVATRWLIRRPRLAGPALPILMMVDVLLFSVLLFLTGGPTNPFSFLYLVYIALAAVVLQPRWSWALSALALGAFGALFFVSPEAQHADHMGLHLQGMWLGFGVAAGFIVYFVHRVTRALNVARQQAARHDQLTSLATLAAGAAHELSTPLATIAVIARELELRPLSADQQDDVKLIREQVERCRQILNQMAIDVGAGVGESPVSRSALAWISAAAEGLPGHERLDVSVGASEEVVGPPRALAQALRSLLKNALQASPRPVQVRLVGGRLEVRDAGAGMSSEVLSRAGEPFFTTKAPGEGLGLGLYLTRAVMTQLGGGLELTSRSGEGTVAVLVLPASAVRQPGADV
jgi:two-component system sensor histidine kinase RegB